MRQARRSFPSGHTADAFLSVGLIFALEKICNEQINTTYKAALIGSSVLTGISRYFARMHWPKDIIFGAEMGLFFGSIPVLLMKHSQTS